MKTLMTTLLLSLASTIPALATPRFACNLGALTKSERAAHERISAALLSSVEERKELKNGYAFRLPASSLVPAAQWVANERKCCPFFAFQIEVAGSGDLWLRLTGPEGVKPFIVAELGLDP
jgi:hypothetical protein